MFVGIEGTLVLSLYAFVIWTHLVSRGTHLLRWTLFFAYSASTIRTLVLVARHVEVILAVNTVLIIIHAYLIIPTFCLLIWAVTSQLGFHTLKSLIYFAIILT